jgi:CBS domain-containing protein
MTETFSSFLERTTIKDLKKSGSLVVLSEGASVQSAFETLNANQITAAAVYDLTQRKFLGFVDTLDLTVFVVRVFSENFEKHPHLYDPKELQLRFQMPVKEVINASKRDVFHPVESSQSLHFLISNFLQYSVHRVPVLENGKMVGIVSQSDVIKFLSKHTRSLTDTMTKTINELGMSDGNVISVRVDMTVMKAFSKILCNNITGLAVVDLNGRLVNNISASDLKGVSLASFYKLEIPIHEAFLYSTSKLPPVTCDPKHTLGEVIEIIERTGVHRVFVVDSENRPINVITLTDIIKRFANPSV